MQGCLEHSYRYKHFVLNMLYIASSSIVIHFALAIESYLPFVTPCYAMLRCIHKYKTPDRRASFSCQTF